MSTGGSGFISAFEVTNLAGIQLDGVYKAIRRKKIKAETVYIDGKKEFNVPTKDLLEYLENKMSFHTTKASYLEKSIKILKEHIRNER